MCICMCFLGVGVFCDHMWQETAQLDLGFLKMTLLSNADDFILAERPSHASPAGLYDAIPSLNVPNILCTAQ